MTNTAYFYFYESFKVLKFIDTTRESFLPMSGEGKVRNYSSVGIGF